MDFERIRYDKDSYHCEHFLIDVYREFTGVDLTTKLLTSGFFHVSNLRNFVKVDKPSEHTIVLFRDTNKAHVGLWHDNKVLHLDTKGVVLQHVDIVKMGFKRVDYYEIV